LDDAFQQKLLQQFDREAAILTRLAHPQIVKVRDHFVEKGRSYMVMEHIAGQNLRKLVLQHGFCDEPFAVEIGIQLAEVLAYLHGQSPAVVHRDVTPDNIIWNGSTRRLHLVDFGAANIFVGKGTGTLIGKRSYMAPEQFRGKAEPASDVYALGASMYFLLTGRDPLPLGGFGIEPEESVSDEMRRLLTDLGEMEVACRPTCAELMTRLQGVESFCKGE
jgi:serine/threonine-protein kinase